MTPYRSEARNLLPPLYFGGQIDRRRERNRILARRTRLRKKFFFESLQKQMAELQRENTVLKDIIKVGTLCPACGGLSFLSDEPEGKD